jgi:hypothetical protein
LADFDAGIKTVATFGKNAKARVHFGLTTAYMIGDDLSPNSAEYLRRRTVAYLIDAAIEKKIISESTRNEFFGEFGFFPVKYNPESRNLGEYLFRSGTYYPYINSGFELADKEKLTGLHGKFTHNMTEKSNVKADLFFSSDMRDFPVHDFSLSYILSANFGGVFDISAGAMHAHLISFDKRKSTPYYDTTLFPHFDGKRVYDVSRPDYPDTGDTVIYTFKGTKVMSRFTFDPKPLFGVDIFGKEDLKFYCETAILGLKNYPIWYEDINERRPIMFGFNFPTFKALDVFAIELEHNPSPYLNTAETAWRNRSPLPYVSDMPYKSVEIAEIDTLKPITNDDWKWSFYMSRKFGHFRVSGQVASDHMIRIPYMVGPPTNSKYTEICPRTKDWYWMLRVMYMF